jgi:hypothetical protein
MVEFKGSLLLSSSISIAGPVEVSEAIMDSRRGGASRLLERNLIIIRGTKSRCHGSGPLFCGIGTPIVKEIEFRELYFRI